MIIGKITMVKISSLLIITNINWLLATQNFGKFVKSQVKENSCPYGPLSTSTTYGSIDCASTCALEPRCRKFLFCSSDSKCKLFDDGTECYMSGDSSSCTCFRKTIGNVSGDITCSPGYYGDTCQQIVEDCEEFSARGLGNTIKRIGGLISVQPKSYPEPFEIYCILRGEVSALILSRYFYCNFEDFNRSMAEYETGFGSIYRNSWIGFDKLLAILNNSPENSYTLGVYVCKDQCKDNSDECYMMYDNFSIGNKSTGYAFYASGFRVNPNKPCGDSILGNVSLLGNPFSTYDVDHTGINACTERFGSAWWFQDSPECTRSLLTGNIILGTKYRTFWKDSFGNSRLVYATMNLKRM